MDRYQTAQGQITAFRNTVCWTGTKLDREIPEVGGPNCLKFMLSGNELENCCLCSSLGNVCNIAGTLNIFVALLLVVMVTDDRPAFMFGWTLVMS